jgi:hypothetical protein
MSDSDGSDDSMLGGPSLLEILARYVDKTLMHTSNPSKHLRQIYLASSANNELILVGKKPERATNTSSLLNLSEEVLEMIIRLVVNPRCRGKFSDGGPEFEAVSDPFVEDDYLDLLEVCREFNRIAKPTPFHCWKKCSPFDLEDWQRLRLLHENPWLSEKCKWLYFSVSTSHFPVSTNHFSGKPRPGEFEKPVLKLFPSLTMLELDSSLARMPPTWGCS